MFVNTHIKTVAKCIIAGEHAVLRGHPAIAYPLNHYALTLTYQTDSSPIRANFGDQSSNKIAELFWDTFDHALTLVHQNRSKLTGQFTFTNTIPLGVNLGGSAALCVAIAKWCLAQGWIQSDAVIDFAKELEHRFHGQSSGIDIAVVAYAKPIYFEKGKITPLMPVWQPNWFVSNCDDPGLTKHCVEKVNHLWQTNPDHAQQIDQQMHESVTTIKSALLSNIEANRLLPLSQAIQQAADCFAKWDLIQPQLAKHIDYLYQHGAIAVKPTGAGSGGHVVSLWDGEIPTLLQAKLLPLSNN